MIVSWLTVWPVTALNQAKRIRRTLLHGIGVKADSSAGSFLLYMGRLSAAVDAIHQVLLFFTAVNTHSRIKSLSYRIPLAASARL